MLLTDLKKAIKEHNEASIKLKKQHLENQKLIDENLKLTTKSSRIMTQGEIVASLLKPYSSDDFVVKKGCDVHLVKHREVLDISKLLEGTRVTLDVQTLTILNILPRHVDSTVYKMLQEEPGSVKYSEIGGLTEQIRELREVVELPLKNPELFARLGIDCPKGCLLYGPPGTGKTLLARAVASQVDASFLKVVASAIVDKYIGESARIVRELFEYARDHVPCIIFIDEIDAIGARRLDNGSSSDREIQRTLMELLTQLDGFKKLDGVKVIMATNRPDVLDPALLRPGRLDRKIEVGYPNDEGRYDILQLHSAPLAKRGEIDWDSIVSITEGMSGADLRNVCTEAGMCAIRAERDWVEPQDFVKSARKVAVNKKLESKMEYKPK